MAINGVRGCVAGMCPRGGGGGVVGSNNDAHGEGYKGSLFRWEVVCTEKTVQGGRGMGIVINMS